MKKGIEGNSRDRWEMRFFLRNFYVAYIFLYLFILAIYFAHFSCLFFVLFFFLPSITRTTSSQLPRFPFFLFFFPTSVVFFVCLFVFFSSPFQYFSTLMVADSRTPLLTTWNVLDPPLEHYTYTKIYLRLHFSSRLILLSSSALFRSTACLRFLNDFFSLRLTCLQAETKDLWPHQTQQLLFHLSAHALISECEQRKSTDN